MTLKELSDMVREVSDIKADAFERRFAELSEIIERTHRELETKWFATYTEVGGWDDITLDLPGLPATEFCDADRYPHTCPRCGGPAYVGALEVDCRDWGTKDCVK